MARAKVNARRSYAERGADMYPTPREATWSLVALESLPRVIWEPAAGDGAIVQVLEDAGHDVIPSDLIDYGVGFWVADYLATPVPPGAGGIVTNPPYRRAEPFLQKALGEVPYVALLLRTNFLESVGRLPFFRAHPPARVWISSRRLPMMHRRDWDGPRSSSNHTFAWLVWDAGARQGGQLLWFDWREHVR
jgi:hypothetical protein